MGICRVIFPGLIHFPEEEELEEEENPEEVHGERERQVDTDASKEKALRKLDFQNPLFHMPLESDALKEMQQTNATAR